MTPSPGTTATRDIAYQLHPFTNLRKHEAEGPLVITGGRGIYVQDESGREYIEALAGLWCASLGFGEERLVEAATRQMRKLPFYHQFASQGARHRDRPGRAADRAHARAHVQGVLQQLGLRGQRHRGEARLVLQQRARPPPEEEDHLAAARLSRHHGGERRASPASRSAHRDFDLPLPQVRHADCPDYYRHGRPGESEEDFATRMAESLDALIQREDPDTVAAFIAEPVMGAGGVVVPPRTYFDKVQAVLKKHDVLFIADEVICGFGRTGKMFGSETYRAQARHHGDGEGAVLAYLPISATAISEAIYQAPRHRERQARHLRPRLHVLRPSRLLRRRARDARIMKERDLIGHVGRIGPRLQAGSAVRRASAGGRRARRGPGRRRGARARQGDARAVRSAGLRRAPSSWRRRRAHGLIVRNLQDTIALCPPLIITEAELDEVLRRFELALTDTAKAV